MSAWLGRRRFRRDFPRRCFQRKPIPTPKSLYGMATSPIAHGDNLILVLDNDANLPDSKLSQSRITTVKKATGELVWETARPLVRSGWSTPTIWKHNAGEDLVVLGSSRVCGYDPGTGVEKWFVTGFSRETIAQPVSGNGQVYVSSAMLGGAADEQPNRKSSWRTCRSRAGNRSSRRLSSLTVPEATQVARWREDSARGDGFPRGATRWIRTETRRS